MADSASDQSRSAVVLSVDGAIAAMWVVGAPSGDRSRVDDLTPLEREGARYGYQEAGQPFGPTEAGLEIWLELRALGKED
jgi:hypothetical protein